LPAIALTTDTSIITSVGNDYHFEQIFIKQLQALGSAGDVAIGISTSGNSPNVVKAMETAQQIGLRTIGFTGQGGQLAQYADVLYAVASAATPCIQETHITLAHILCDLVERNIFEPVF
jgi:D-sedoheptulose 7-phosphate isomerase